MLAPTAHPTARVDGTEGPAYFLSCWASASSSILDSRRKKKDEIKQMISRHFQSFGSGLQEVGHMKDRASQEALRSFARNTVAFPDKNKPGGGWVRESRLQKRVSSKRKGLEELVTLSNSEARST